MSTQPGYEQAQPPADFRDKLRSAMAQPNQYGSEDPLDNSEAIARFQDKPDGYIINSYYLPNSHQVSTDNPSDYLLLLQQAAEVLQGNDEQTESELSQLYLMAKHELEHGNVAAQFGNSHTVSHYGVEFV